MNLQELLSKVNTKAEANLTSFPFAFLQQQYDDAATAAFQSSALVDDKNIVKGFKVEVDFANQYAYGKKNTYFINLPFYLDFPNNPDLPLNDFIRSHVIAFQEMLIKSIQEHAWIGFSEEELEQIKVWDKKDLLGSHVIESDEIESEEPDVSFTSLSHWVASCLELHIKEWLLDAVK